MPRGMGYGVKRFNKVKRLARAGWRGGPKPKKVGKHILSGIVSYGKKAAMEAAVVGLDAAKAHANMSANIAIRSAGAAASVTTGNPGPSMAAEAAIMGKDHLLQKYFGAQHNRTSSHSGRNYAIKRKPAVRYHSADASPAARSTRLIRKGGLALLHTGRYGGSFRNTNHLYSASHPTGARI